jgi:hypothetical protein
VEIEFLQAKEAGDVKSPRSAFSASGNIHFKFVPKGNTVNQTFYMEVLKRLIDVVKHK